MAHRATFELGGFAWADHATRPSSEAEAPPLIPHTVAVLRFALPRAGRAMVNVQDAHGNLVRTLLEGELTAGEHACGWDGRDDWLARAPAGDYTLRLEVGDQLVTARRVSIAPRP